MLKLKLSSFLIILLVFNTISCMHEKESDKKKEIKIIFLHHSTGERIWYGDKSSLSSKIYGKLSDESAVTRWFKRYNKANKTNYIISELDFPKNVPYGWNNFPFDYYNIWVKNTGNEPFQQEPTLEILTEKYDVIIWKHCFPVGNIVKDTGKGSIDSEVKSIENYKLQYLALRNKMQYFPNNKFIVWTGAALTKENTTLEKANRTRHFIDWVRNEWDEPSDNIFLWDFYQLETGGDLFMKDAFAESRTDPHPNNSFAGKSYSLFCKRVVDIIESGGINTELTGQSKQY